MANESDQGSLFTAAEQRALRYSKARTQPTLDLDAEALQIWKTKIYHYQQQVQASQPLQQTTLFRLDASSVDPVTIDPFELEYHNFFFFNWPSDRHPSDPCIYFVIDTTMPLLLYVGETCQANQRWKGVHDCKQYVLNYQSAHFKHHLPTTINTAFWWETPAATRPRQQLEFGLIKHWKSPFNKENWSTWHTPFVD